MSQKKIRNFMGLRHYAVGLSVILLLISIGSLATKGLQFGLDFTGGAQIELGFAEPVDINTVRSQLVAAGYESPVVVQFGAETDVLIKMQRDFEQGLGEAVIAAVTDNPASVELRRVEFVGPQVGDELRDDGFLGLLFALAMVMLYVAMRFQFKFSVGAVVSLIHDVIIVVGFFSLTGMEVDLTVLAAVLAVIGYSINDTIVVFDRIRENFRKLRQGTATEVINVSLSETLDRTIMTSFTTQLVLLALFFFGGELLHGFATALLLGIFVGTYSSIYVASNLLVILGVSKEDLMPPEKEKEEFETP